MQGLLMTRAAKIVLQMLCGKRVASTVLLGALVKRMASVQLQTKKKKQQQKQRIRRRMRRRRRSVRRIARLFL